jgi:hypothetical protein
MMDDPRAGPSGEQLMTDDVVYTYLQLILPLVALTAVPALVLLLPAWWRAQDRKSLLRLAASALERDRPLSPETLQALPGARWAAPDSARDLRRGALLIAVGVGIALIGAAIGGAVAAVDPSAALATGSVVAALGVMPACLGVAYAVLGGIQRRAESR